MSDRKFYKKRRFELDDDDDAAASSRRSHSNYFGDPGPSSRVDPLPPPLPSEDYSAAEPSSRRFDTYYSEAGRVDPPSRAEDTIAAGPSRQQSIEFYGEPSQAGLSSRHHPQPEVEADRRVDHPPPRSDNAAVRHNPQPPPPAAAAAAAAAAVPAPPAAAVPPVRFVNLAPNEDLLARRDIPPLNIHLGHNIYVELKQFRRASYIGLYKNEDGVVKNRFNFPLALVDKVQEAFDIVKAHARDSMP